MLLLWTFVPFVLFTTVTNALRNGRQLRSKLGTGFGHTTRRRRSLAGRAFTVEVIQIYHYRLPSTFPMLNTLLTNSS